MRDRLFRLPRDDTLKALQVTLGLGLDQRFVIESQTWEMAESLGGAALVEIIRRDTHSCYLGDHSTLHAWGYGCGACPACELRARGFERYSNS